MNQITKQMNKWMNEFGKNYTDRNIYSPEDHDKFYMSNYGKTRTELNNNFLGNISKNIKILEVGSNVGNQLLTLQKMGFMNLYGIEINQYAIELSKTRTKNINIIQGSAFDIPFKDDYFELVFTSGVLIHICPDDILKVMKETCRCSNTYIWGLEYYSDEYTEINYRDNENMMWKADYADIYMENIPGLELIKKEKYKYIDNNNVDAMFLLKKHID